MKVAFLGHEAHLTGFLDSVARNIAAAGNETQFWSSSHRAVQQAEQAEYYDRALYIDCENRRNSEDARAWLRELEEEEAANFINRDLAADRYFNNKPSPEVRPSRTVHTWSAADALTFLEAFGRSIDHELFSNPPDVLYLEVNAAAYRLTHRLATRRHIPAGSFRNSLFWPHRWYFDDSLGVDWNKCRDAYERLVDSELDEELRATAQDRLDQIRATGHQPEYVDLLKSGPRRLSVSFLLSRLRSHFVEWIRSRRADSGRRRSPWTVRPDTVSPSARFARWWESRQRRRYYRRIRQSALPNKGTPTVAFFLHLQPEVPADELAFRFRDQAAVIRNIAASLPAGGICVVKEHPAQAGRRARHEYAEINNIPNVELLSHDIHPHHVILSSDVVTTLAGTVALEAVLYGVPAVVMGDIFFDRFRGIHKANSYGELEQWLSSVDRLTRASESDALVTLAAIYRASNSVPHLREAGARKHKGNILTSMLASHL